MQRHSMIDDRVQSALQRVSLPLFLRSPQRQQLYEMAGAGQTPYLVDPNTGAKGYESSEINDYLDLTYAL